jgi:hypothetical protein
MDGFNINVSIYKRTVSMIVKTNNFIGPHFVKKLSIFSVSYLQSTELIIIQFVKNLVSFDVKPHGNK